VQTAAFQGKQAMKPFTLICLAATSLVAAPAVAQNTAAPAAAPQKQIVPGLAVANVDEVKAASNALINAAKERQTVYRNVIARAEARSKQVNDQIAPLQAKYQSDLKSGTVSQTELQQQAQAIQTMLQNGQQAVNTILAPVTLSNAYVLEQINDVIGRAIANAMTKTGVTFVLPPQMPVAFDNYYNLNPTILAELNALLPVAKVTPPAGWQPRAVREAQAAKPAPGKR
jgi:Skp family chaperone for outer membrane proteins